MSRASAAPAQRARVLILEPENRLRESLDTLLREAGYRSLPVSDPGHVTRSTSAELCVVSLTQLHGPSAKSFVVTLKRANPDIRTIAINHEDDQEATIAVLEDWADDCLTTPFSLGEFLARVRVQLRRLGVLRPKEWGVDDLVLNEETRRVTFAGRILDVTATEFRLLRAFLRNAGRVLSKEELLHLVWNYESTNRNVVEFHVGRVRRKLSLVGGPPIETVRGAGYIMMEAATSGGSTVSPSPG